MLYKLPTARAPERSLQPPGRGGWVTPNARIGQEDGIVVSSSAHHVMLACSEHNHTCGELELRKRFRSVGQPHLPSDGGARGTEALLGRAISDDTL